MAGVHLPPLHRTGGALTAVPLLAHAGHVIVDVAIFLIPVGTLAVALLILRARSRHR
jgi:hypothetical protein